MREDRMIAAAVVRPGAAQRAGADAHHHRRVHLAVGHVAQLRRLQNYLPGGFEREIGEHQVRDVRAAGRRGADCGGGEALLGDRRVDHPLRPELLPQTLCVGEAAAALAGAFAEIEDAGLRAHLLGDAVAHRLEPARVRDGRCRGAAASASGGLIGSA